MSREDRPRGVIRLGGDRQETPRNRPPASETPRTATPRPEVLLTRSAPDGRVSGRGGRLAVNLNWSAATEADLDLGCLVAMDRGSPEVVQALGESFGSLTSPPYVELDQDDRTGAGSDGETLRVNLEYRARLRRLLFYVYVYEGAADFRTLGAAVTVSAPSGTFRILLDDSPAGATACAVALATSDSSGLAVRREVRWFTSTPDTASNQELVDQAYDFGLTWVPMRKA